VSAGPHDEGTAERAATDHLEGRGPIYIYRVANRRRALADSGSRPEKRLMTLEIPMGPCCSFRTRAASGSPHE